MKNIFIPPILFIFLIAVFAGCGLSADNKEAQETVDKFYNALKSGKIDSAAALCRTDANMQTEDWVEVFSNNTNSVGNVTKYSKKSGFDVSKNNGVSSVKLRYDVEYQYGKSNDSLVLVDEGAGFKLMVYSPIVEQADYLDGIALSEQRASSYFSTLIARDYSGVLKEVGYSGAEKHSPDEWQQFYSRLDKTRGPITSYLLENSKSISYPNTVHSEAGEGNVYRVFVITMRNNIETFETLDLYQPEFGDDIKVVAHFCN